MTEQTKVQRLADLLETNIWDGKCGQKERDEAAAELRRLDALNAELVEALGFIVKAYRDAVNGKTSFYMPVALRKADAALTKAKEQT